MVLILFLILIEALSLAVLRQHFFVPARTRYYIFVLIHVILSIWFWILLVAILGHKSFFDTPDNIWRIMALAGMIIAVILPRFLLIILHFTGKWLRRDSGGHIRWLTNTGLVVGAVMLGIIAWGTFIGKLNFRYENVPIHIKGLHHDLEGFRIVHISDLHLAGFYHNQDELLKVISRINSLSPDMIINTGDFITFGWREFGRTDTVLAKSRSEFGNFAVIGNHDAGTYHPEYTEADLENHVLKMNQVISASGYELLNDSFSKVRVGEAVIGLIGVTTGGRHPHIVHGNLDSASAGLDSVDLKILLTHDPNHWINAVSGKRTDILLCLSGHTHGMQMGIMTEKVKWSPVKFFYPNWNGIYTNNDQVHYVNRGLGVLAIPFRIWMPPEITIITLHATD